MKKLHVNLLSDEKEHFLPGDTVQGLAMLSTSSSVKYSCIKIHFTGLVSTKIAKAQEQVYVINQQVVLAGNANNESEFIIKDGKHSWPFEFQIPLQHIPSSGKYRHGTIKYTIAAIMTSPGFMGGMQETKATKVIQIRDLINLKAEPYSDPIIVKGGSNLKPNSDAPKHYATATVKLARSAYLKGQQLHVEIDLYHPNKIRRSPGCFFQLIRKESYHAGESAKEFSEKVVTSAEELAVSKSLSTGKITTDLTIPDSVISTLLGAKIMTVEYRLVILFDMRSKTGFMEGRHSKKVKPRMRNKLLSSPGGFEIEVPVFIGTVSDDVHSQRLDSLYQASIVPRHPSTSSSSSSPIVASSTAKSLSSLSSSSQPSPSFAHASAPELPGYTHGHAEARSNPPLGYGAKPAPARRQVSDTPQVWAPPDSASYSYPRSRSYSASPSFGLPLYPPSSSAGPSSQSYPIPPDAKSRPLPAVPQPATQFQQSPIPFASPTSISPSYVGSSSRLPMPLVSVGPPGKYAPATHPLPRLPPREPSATFPRGLESMPNLNPTAHVPEKTAAPPSRNLQLPHAMRVEIPTAPSAVDLGLGPASPPAEDRRVSNGSSSSRGDNWPLQPPEPLMSAAQMSKSVGHLPYIPRNPQAVLNSPGVASPTAPPLHTDHSQRGQMELHGKSRHEGYPRAPQATGYSNGY